MSTSIKDTYYFLDYTGAEINAILKQAKTFLLTTEELILDGGLGTDEKSNSAKSN